MYKTKPFPYQEEIIDKSYDMLYAFMRLDPGLGKSKITIDSFCRLFKEGKIDNVLIITKKSVAENWAWNELPEHMWEDVGHVTALWGSRTGTEARILNFCRPTSALRIVSINIEALRSDKVHALIKRFVQSGRTFLVIDESTIIKNGTATQTKRCLSLSTLATYRRCLSGEPAPNGPIDLYSQYKFLSSDLFPNFTKARFEETFCELQIRFFGGRRVVVPQGFTISGQQLFEQIVGPYTFSVRKSDVDLPWPEIKNETIRVKLSEAQLKVYEGLQQDVVYELDKAFSEFGTVRADVIVARLVKLHQITSGFVVTEDDTAQAFPINPKLDALVSVLPGKQCIIWAHYRHDVDTVTQRLRDCGYAVGRIYGGIKDHEREDTLKAFKSGDIQYLVANPASIGWGLTLTCADTAIYYSNHYNYEYKLQSRDRIHRIGQHSPFVTYIDIVAANTIDELIIQALENKEKFSAKLFISEFVQKLIGKKIDVVGELPKEDDEAA